MPNQARILIGSQAGFSLFVTNWALTRVLSTNFDVVSDFENSNSIPKPFLKKQAILNACRRQYLINGRTILVNTNGAALSSKGITAKTE